MGNKKLLFITTRIFWPATSGRKVSLYYYCKGLHEQYGYDIYLYSFLEADQAPTQSEQTKPDFIKEIQFAREVRKSEIVANLITKSFSHLQWPLQCSLFYSKKNEENIRDYVSKEHFDVVIADMIRTAPYIRAFEGEPCLKILDMDDLLSKRYQRTLSSTVSGDNFLGQYSKYMPNIVNKQLIPRVKKIALNMEVSRLLCAEVERSDTTTSYLYQMSKPMNLTRSFERQSARQSRWAWITITILSKCPIWRWRTGLHSSGTLATRRMLTRSRSSRQTFSLNWTTK